MTLDSFPTLMIVILHGKEVYPHIHMELLMFQFVSIAPHPVTEHQQKEPGPLCLAPALEVLSTDNIPSQLLFSMLNSPRALCLSSYRRCTRPVSIFVALCWTLSRRSLSFLNWGAQHWLSAPDGPSSQQSRGTHLPALLPMLSATHTGQPLAFSATGHTAGSWLTCWPPARVGAVPQSSFPAAQPPACTDACSYSSPHVGLYTCSC